MEFEIETCGNTEKGCSVCGRTAYKYVTCNDDTHHITCNNAMCLVDILLLDSFRLGEGVPMGGKVCFGSSFFDD